MVETIELQMSSADGQAFNLPPLILHPFSNAEEASILKESTRASQALQNLAPANQQFAKDLERKMMRGRYAELRMLFYVGKDVMRWSQQCAETVIASGEYAQYRIRPETFVVFLVNHIPEHVRLKLDGWGVMDFRALFRRSTGLHATFEELPEASFFSADFLRHYHRWLDQWYEQRLRDVIFDRPDGTEFTFDLYASGEYSTKLEKSWSDNPAE